jgi:PDZ domain-containing protein
VLRKHSSTLLWGLAAVVVAAFGFAWIAPSHDYLYVPNTATPVASRVTVEGEQPHAAGPGAIYYVDVSIRRATWAESKIAFLRPDGASLVPHAEVVPTGSTFAARHEEGLREMARSEKVAAAVALEKAGFKVKTIDKGALIEGVASDAPAATKLQEGDVIVAARGKPVATPDDLRSMFKTVHPGDDVVLRIRRNGTVETVTVRTVEAPDRPGHAIIGISVSQSADIKLPVKVNIDLGQVGGPSAGLPFALDVLQELGTNVDHGLKVVATGEMELDGTVAPIGGVKQKTYGARRAGADVFLVPAGENAAEARRYAGNLRIIPVTSFQQALSSLSTISAN